MRATYANDIIVITCSLFVLINPATAFSFLPLSRQHVLCARELFLSLSLSLVFLFGNFSMMPYLRSILACVCFCCCFMVVLHCHGANWNEYILCDNGGYSNKWQQLHTQIKNCYVSAHGVHFSSKIKWKKWKTWAFIKWLANENSSILHHDQARRESVWNIQFEEQIGAFEWQTLF